MALGVLFVEASVFWLPTSDRSRDQKGFVGIQDHFVLGSETEDTRGPGGCPGNPLKMLRETKSERVVSSMYIYIHTNVDLETRINGRKVVQQWSET